MRMARFRGARRLTCFYCGKRSGLKNDGATRDFLCLYCDATNYLDENGEITDPPVATDGEAEATTMQYAAPKRPTPTDSTFCQTCLKNQHLFTKSLAQYFPDDPADPEYAQLERNYYRYRKGLERRYPQVCDECAEKVEHRIRQAGYTAKTDHLRRMMDMSRGRKPTRRTTVLDWVNGLGRTTWRAGFVLQMLWHLVIVVQVLHHGDNGMHDPDDISVLASVLAGLKHATKFLPGADALIQWSIAAAFLSAWWNPHFVQVNRGFTKHLLGFTQWYSFQGLIVFFRLAFRRVLDIKGGQAQSMHAQLSAHMVMAAGMVLIYVLAGKSIRVDTSPLFATYDKPVLPKQAKTPAKRKQEDSKTVSELFNDALESANGTPCKPPQLDLSPSPRVPRVPFNPARPELDSEISFGNLGLAGTPTHRPQQVQYAEEMDWSPVPVAPQHRAFANQSSPSKGASMHGQAPTHSESSNPFWYKVPAAPSNPARRLRNPPRAPEPKQEPAEANKALFTSRHGEATQKKEAGEASSGVEFRQPKFFAPASGGDDASSLADLLNQSFSLSQEQDQEEQVGAENGGIWDGMQSRKKKSPSPNSRSDGAGMRPVEPLVLAGLLATWLLTLFPDIPYGWECQTAIMAVAGIIALRVTGETSEVVEPCSAPGPAVLVLSALGIAELAAVCWVASEAWKGETTDVGLYGAGVLAAMLSHQTLRHLI
ncbi:Integral inner nuclear membrane protein ima1 [Tolypocladium ophioglossoides CBS 100239]|uniref:Integral inner nuclear membrane protein ima1 n=1 Tax=Tolypocladium ophioglossoides (strain CBS 100239) TaxID=1163406 RepID=A0A0L0NJW6_TOLOC|nr:Integral inner nuclear membrane protein ima1 [Tolypocladium ophioglossoides CBS 100239]